MAKYSRGEQRSAAHPLHFLRKVLSRFVEGDGQKGQRDRAGELPSGNYVCKAKLVGFRPLPKVYHYESCRVPYAGGKISDVGIYERRVTESKVV